MLLLLNNAALSNVFVPGNPSQAYLVPIAKICESSAPSPWNFITCKGIKVSVYGPRNIHATTHFCVSVSTVDFSPPSLSLQHSQNKYDNIIMHETEF